MSVRKSKNPVVALTSGFIAGGIEATAVWPMEFIKTQLQLGRSASAALPYNSVFGGISHTVRTTGFLSLYNGLAPNLLGAMPKAGLRFGVAGHVRESLKDPQTGRISPWANLLGGLIAGATEATLVVTPVETVKTKCIQMNAPFVAGVKEIVKASGLGGLYQGLVPTVMKQSSNQGLRFMIYNEYKCWLTGERDTDRQPRLSPHQALLGGMFAGCCSTIGNNPFDFLKTRMQGVNAHMYNSTLHCLRESVSKEGILVLYRGVTPRLGRVVPGQGIIFMSFEIIQSYVAKFLNVDE